MTDGTDRAGDQARFAAREFIGRYQRETGELPPPAFAYEMGYLRGRSDSMQESMNMFDEISQSRDRAEKDNEAADDDTE